LVVGDRDRNRPLTGISPFLMKKWFDGVSTTGFQEVKALRSGDYLVTCLTKRASGVLLKRHGSSFMDRDLDVTVHERLNSSRGVIRCRELAGQSDLEIRTELAEQGVTEVRRVSVKRNGVAVPTHTFFVTFAMAKLPSDMKVGYLKIPVTPFVPSPMRCYKCQKFGHTSQRCKEAEICHQCGSAKHDDQCVDEVKCVNCGGGHASSSRECPTFKKEQAIQKIRAEKNIPFAEARKMVTAKEGTSYASKAAAAVTNASSSADQQQQNQLLLKLMEQMAELVKVIAKLTLRIESMESKIRAKDLPVPPVHDTALTLGAQAASMPAPIGAVRQAQAGGSEATKPAPAQSPLRPGSSVPTTKPAPVPATKPAPVQQSVAGKPAAPPSGSGAARPAAGVGVPQCRLPVASKPQGGSEVLASRGPGPGPVLAIRGPGPGSEPGPDSKMEVGGALVSAASVLQASKLANKGSRETPNARGRKGDSRRQLEEDAASQNRFSALSEDEAEMDT
jgi:hypothetical protein